MEGMTHPKANDKYK